MKEYEQRLALLASRGDRDAFRKIVEDNKKKIFYLAYDLTGSTQDAEDLSQEVFIKAYRSIDKFRGDASLSSWLYRITVNAFLDIKRKKSYNAEKQQDALDEGLASDPVFEQSSANRDPEKHAESKQIQMHIDQALEHLSPRERTVFIMRHYQGQSGKEIGASLGISTGTVKSLMSRALNKLQKVLGSYRHPLSGFARAAGKEAYQ